MRALVVDDSSTMRSILKIYLKKSGFDVLEAGNGREALTKLSEQGTVEVALVDWNMPEMNGLEFVTALRTDTTYAKTKVVMVTTEAGIEEVSKALAAGADEYIMKPFTRDIVVEKLQMLGFE